jgi:hypothetical protein
LLHLSCTVIPSVQKLPSFSPKCPAALAGLHFTVDRVSEHSCSKSSTRTDASRVSWYRDNLCKCHKIVDPYPLDVNNYQEANLLFACYAVFLALGHTLLCKTIKSRRSTIIFAPQPTLSSKLAFKYTIQPTISNGMTR